MRVNLIALKMIQLIFQTVINFYPSFLCNILYIEMVKSYCVKQKNSQNVYQVVKLLKLKMTD